jgi:histidinol-phosphatase (PHP family)
MFDFHIHSKVSFDSSAEPCDIISAAEAAGLSEICFTDHYDFNSDQNGRHDFFSLRDYSLAYDTLTSDKLLIRRGVEFGLTTWNTAELASLVSNRKFDFVLGSVHYVDGNDPYSEEYWRIRNYDTERGFRDYLNTTLECVRVHDGFDVLGHLNYVCKSKHNPSGQPLRYSDHKDISDAIMKELIKRGKGMEINTSGVDRSGDFLPSKPFLERFYELGGRIVTIGSDAHDMSRVGQYTAEAAKILKDVFGYVCTYEGREPIFHKL